AQIQAGTLAALTIKAYDITGPTNTDPTEGRDLISQRGTGASVPIRAVTILHPNGTSETGTPGSPTTHISFASGVATVSGLNAGDTFDWKTSSKSDQVLITDTAKF